MPEGHFCQHVPASGVFRIHDSPASPHNASILLRRQPTVHQVGENGAKSDGDMGQYAEELRASWPEIRILQMLHLAVVMELP